MEPKKELKAIELIQPDPGQPRTFFDPVKISEMADSMRNGGFWQHEPIKVRENPDGEGWIIIHGERRWTSARKAGLREIPVIVLSYPATEKGARDLYMDQWLDNEMRENLRPMESIQAQYKMVTEMGATVALIAKRTGKSVATIKADLPLAKLPPTVRKAVDNGTLPKTVAREIAAVAALPKGDPLKAFTHAMKNARSTKTMLAGLDAYRIEIGQGKLDFDLVIEDAKDNNELKEARAKWDTFVKQFAKFEKFTDKVEHATARIVAAKNRQRKDIELIAANMKKISEKLLSDCHAYRAQKGDTVRKKAA